jgi:hypothetical protein
MYDYFQSYERNSEISIRCAELQLRFLMSSDVYEREGLVDPLMEVLEHDLSVPNSSQVNGDINVNGDCTNHKISAWSLARCRNAVAITSRILLEPVSRHRKNGIFEKLLILDQWVVSGSMRQYFDKKHQTEFLVTIRHAMIHFVNSVAKFVIEASLHFTTHLIHRIINLWTDYSRCLNHSTN